MTREEKKKAIDALKISAPIMAVTQEKFKDYIQTLNQVMDWLEQEPKTGHWIEHECEEMREKGYYRCSVCNHGYQRYTKGIRKSDVPYIDGQEYIIWNIDHYCPNCGANMGEVKHED